MFLRIVFTAALLALVSYCMPLPAHAQGYSIEMGVTSPEVAQFFQQHAGPADIARVDHPSDVGLIAGLTVGRRMVIFKSASQIEQFLASNASSVDIIGWNLEPGQQHDPSELADPVEAAKRVRAIAQQYGKQVAIGLNHDLTLQYGAAMARSADLWVLQIQRATAQQATEFVGQMVPALKRANPNIAIYAQIRTDSDPRALRQLVDNLGDVNVSILTQSMVNGQRSARDIQDAINVASAFFGQGRQVQQQAAISAPAAAKGDGSVAIAILLIFALVFALPGKSNKESEGT